jgi:selenocysteine lyase/cysteine desulfurase
VLAGIAAAAEFMLSTSLTEESERETHLLAMLQEGLSEVSGVTVVGPSVTPDRAPTVVFTVAGQHPDAVAEFLASRRIAVWSGDNYACELVDALGLRASGGVVRAGVVRYTTRDDVAALLAALAELTA